MESGTDRSYTPRRGLRGGRGWPVPHGLPVGAPVRAPRARGVGGRVRHRDDARDERRVRGVPPRDGRAPARLLARPGLRRPAPARRGALLGGGVRVRALGWRAAADRGGVGGHADPWSPVAHRSSLPPHLRYSDYGVRLARDLAPG